MHDLIDERRAEIALLCRRYGVRQLEVFGSAARATDFDQATSDADFLVDFQSGGLAPLEQFFGLADALSRLLGCPVDLVERGAVRNPFVGHPTGCRYDTSVRRRDRRSHLRRN